VHLIVIFRGLNVVEVLINDGYEDIEEDKLGNQDENYPVENGDYASLFIAFVQNAVPGLSRGCSNQGQHRQVESPEVGILIYRVSERHLPENVHTCY